MDDGPARFHAVGSFLPAVREPHGRDAEEPFTDIMWWVDQEVLRHGAEIALIRDLHRV
ncbi:hypothetical protein [Streptomyces incanus]|uniref:Uncharacterized protein n=1 Tax=Streptomyces incanus TaxID=887453 RepID=A0ABW0XU55_9ACTN